MLPAVWRRKWHPTPVFLPGKSHGQRSLAGTVHGVAKSRSWLSDLAHVYTHTHTSRVSTTALAFPPQTSLSSFWINLSALFAPITTGCMAEWIIHFYILKGILLLPSILYCMAFKFFSELLCILTSFCKQECKLKMSLKIKTLACRSKSANIFSFAMKASSHYLYSLSPQPFL